MRLPVPRMSWAADPLWARAYDWMVEHPVPGGALWALGAHTDIRLLRRAAATVSLLPAGSAVLDVPCGGGVALRGLVPGQGLRYVAADLGPGMLARTRRAAAARRVADQVTTIAADVADLPFDDDEFDLVLSLTGLHCFADPAAAVVELVRVLRPGGTLVVSCVLNDTGVRHLGLRTAGRVSGLMGPGCSGPELLTWLRSQGVVEPTLQRSGALGYVRGVKGPA